MKIFIIEDHQIVKDGLKLILERDPKFTVVGEAENVAKTLELIPKVLPDICLLDINLGNDSGLSLIAPILHLSPGTKVAVLSMHETKEYIIKSFQAGAVAFFPKGIAPSQLLSGLNTLSKENLFLLPGQKEILEEAKNPEHTLTMREIEILKMIAKGLSSKQIAEQLNLSYRTIETHRFNIFKKLNVTNSIEAVSRAADLGLLIG